MQGLCRQHINLSITFIVSCWTTIFSKLACKRAAVWSHPAVTRQMLALQNLIGMVSQLKTQRIPDCKYCCSSPGCKFNRGVAALSMEAKSQHESVWKGWSAARAPATRVVQHQIGKTQQAQGLQPNGRSKALQVPPCRANVQIMARMIMHPKPQQIKGQSKNLDRQHPGQA